MNVDDSGRRAGAVLRGRFDPMPVPAFEEPERAPQSRRVAVFAGIAVVLVIAALAVVAAPWRADDPTRQVAARPHPPVVSSREPVLPDPPEPVFALSGSPDRLVGAAGGGSASDSEKRRSDRSTLRVFAFEFRRWRWTRLPNARWTPIALPDGLAGVGLSCRPIKEGDSMCQIEVSTLRWADRHWRNQQITKRAVYVHEGGSVRSLGVHGRFAYFSVSRESDGRLLRVTADGEVTTLPKLPGSATSQVFVAPICVTRRGLTTVESYLPANLPPGTPNDLIPFGPIWRLDDQLPRAQWKKVPNTKPLELPGPGSFVCGADGLVLLHPPQTSAWTGRGFVTIAGSGTPANAPSPRGPSTCCAPLADGGIAYDDLVNIFRLRNGTWETHRVHLGPGTVQLGALTTVGNLIVYPADDPKTGHTELRVIP